MMVRLRWAGAAALLLVATGVSAQNEGLSGQVAFGYLAQSGNSDNENMNLNFGGDYVAEYWTHGLDGRAVKASTAGVTTAESYGLRWQSKRELSERDYIFGLAAWDKDEFSGYEKQIREVVGYGRRFLDGERHALNAEGGVGARQADLRDGTSEDESIARLSMDYTLQLSETAKFEQRFSVESGSENTYTESATSLTTEVFGNFSVVLSYTIKRNSDVPVGTQKKDTFTAVSLEYSF